MKKLPLQDNSWYFLQMPSGSSWPAVPAHSTLQNYTLPIFKVTFQLHPSTFLGWNNKSMSKSESSSRCIQEAVDKLFQHTPKWKNTHSLCFKLVFNSTQALFWVEIKSLWLKVRLPPDASRKQLTSCCSTPSIMSANRLHFSNEEKSRSPRMKK